MPFASGCNALSCSLQVTTQKRSRTTRPNFPSIQRTGLLDHGAPLEPWLTLSSASDGAQPESGKGIEGTFEKSQFQNQNHRLHGARSRTPPHRMATRGYLAFPPSSLSMLSYPGPSLERSSIHLPNVSSTSMQVPMTLELVQTHHERGSDHNQSDVERLRVCQNERIVAEQSEVEWVRGGGLLRDASGRRDKTRTERVLSGIRLREDEQRRVERWERYEARWRSVFGESREPLTFFDFPWPLCNLVTEKSIDGLTTRAIGEFLFESVGVLGSSATRRERIRCSLLRWHPDKISPLLRRVVAEDMELVQEGVLRVFRALKALQDTERTTPITGTP